MIASLYPWNFVLHQRRVNAEPRGTVTLSFSVGRLKNSCNGYCRIGHVRWQAIGSSDLPHGA
jgi:hypothetical protein